MTRWLLGILTYAFTLSFPYAGLCKQDISPLKVYIDTPSQCAWGEHNALSLDYREHIQKKIPVDFLVELFFLDGSWRNAQKVSITENLENPKKILPALSFPVPRPKSAQLLGVSFCKDSQQRMSCETIPYRNLENILDRHRVQFDKNRRFISLAKAQNVSDASEDKVYYFQIATLLPDGLRLEKQAFGELHARHFFEREAAVGISSVDKVKYTEKLAATASANLRGARESLIIELPVSDQSKCQGASQF